MAHFIRTGNIKQIDQTSTNNHTKNYWNLFTKWYFLQLNIVDFGLCIPRFHAPVTSAQHDSSEYYKISRYFSEKTTLKKKHRQNSYSI